MGAEATQERRVEAGTKTDVVVAEEKSSGDQMKVLESEVKLLEDSLKVNLAAAAAAAKNPDTELSLLAQCTWNIESQFNGYRCSTPFAPFQGCERTCYDDKSKYA